VAWVDYAKGFLHHHGVMMHSTLGVEKAAGDVGWNARAGRVRDAIPHAHFFMISGLFLSRVIDRKLARLPRQEGHPLRLLLPAVADHPVRVQGAGVCRRRRRRRGRPATLPVSLIDPFGTIWFIYLLPNLLRGGEGDAQAPWWIIWLIGAALEMAHVQSGWVVIDEYARASSTSTPATSSRR